MLGEPHLARKFGPRTIQVLNNLKVEELVPFTILNLISTIADTEPESPALISVDGSALSFAELVAFAESMAGDLRVRGIQQDDRIALVLPNGPVSASAFLGVSTAATAAPLNPGYGEDEFRFYLSDTKAKAVLVLKGDESPVRKAAADLDVPVLDIELSDSAGRFRIQGESTVGLAHSPAPKPSDTALVLHTSGTTSRPKLVPLTHENLCRSAGNVARTLQLDSHDRCLNVMPLFHIHGLVAALLASLSAGASVICTQGFDSISFSGWLNRLHPTWYTAVPTMHQAVLATLEGKPNEARKTNLRLIRSSSAALAPSVIARLEDLFGVPVIEAYGMTEASHQMTSNPLPPAARKPGSVGVDAGPRVAIMDESGNLLDSGQEGEVVIQGPTVTSGYETGAPGEGGGFTNGWFRTGDQGRFDRDGYLFLTGRLKEIINRGGEKVAPAEVDEVLLSNDEILESVTFAVPHPTLGEDVVSAVVCRPDADLSEQSVREFAFSRLAEVKVPSRVLVLPSIPKGPTGKIQRIGMADRLADHLATSFVAPDGTAEIALAEIWREVVGVGEIGAEDNFFALGGDSLTAAQVVARIRTQFGVDLPLSSVFRDPTLRGMAARMELLILDELEADGY